MITRTVCPLGCECERVVDDHIERCLWYTEVKGRNPQTDEVYDRNECAMTLTPMLLIANTKEASMLNASMVSLRNETIKRQDMALKMALRDDPDTMKVVEDARAS